MRVLLAFAGFAVVLGGCIQGANQDEQALQDQGPVDPAPIELRSCLKLGGEFYVEASSLSALMPPGYEPVTVGPTGSMARLPLWALVCEEGSIGQQGLGPTRYMGGYIQVTPPPETQDPHIHAYFLNDGQFFSSAD